MVDLLVPAEEVGRLHQFFQSWLGRSTQDGNQPAVRATDELGWAGLEDTLAPEFSMVVPSGDVVSRTAVLEGLRSSFGQRPGLRIEIHHPVTLQEFVPAAGSSLGDTAGEVVTIRYQEWQWWSDETTARVATALLRRNSVAPGGWQWLCLQETWMQAA